MESTLSRFSMRRPRHQTAQSESLEWLARLHAASQSTLDRAGKERDGESNARDELLVERFRKVIGRCACGPKQIGSRGHVIDEAGRVASLGCGIYDVSTNPKGAGTGERTRVFARAVAEYFEAEYAEEAEPPSDIIHVTCTGYVSPSGAQRLVVQKGWGDFTRVTHAYHMGCYASLPATRLAMGCLATSRGKSDPTRRVDIVHTELCTMHIDPSDHSLEQLVVQSLFADGFIRYAVSDDAREPGLRILALSEKIQPNSSDAMSWIVSDSGMKMTLARDVPARLSAALRSFVLELYRDAGLDAATELPRTVFAVHPGGPKIIDAVRDVLELSEAQVQTSRAVLFDYGNMSSATLPHVWMRIIEDGEVAQGTPVLSLAFGPGLTLCGGLFRKQ